MRKLAAIMFSDIAGYSALMSKDEKNAMNILDKNRAIHKSFIPRYNGQYIKEIGDGTLAIFQSAFDAVHCAIQIRNACAKEPGLRIRIGIHIGDVVLQDNDVFGDSVNIASRIESAGEPGGIFVSEKVYDDIRNKEGISAEFYGEKNLKNIPDPVRIYRIMTGENGELTTADYPSNTASSGLPAARKNKKSIIYAAVLVFALVFAFIYSWNKGVFKTNKLEDVRNADGKISVAVMPFFNMTNDSTWNVWQEGIQDMLINSLSNADELKVRQFESVNSLIQSNGIVNYASMTPDLASSISQKLNAGVFIYGNIKKAGPSLRISAQLIDSKTQDVFKSFQVDGSAKEENLFPMLDSLTAMVKDFLLISQMEKELTPDYQRLAVTKSPEAYRYFILGKNAFMKQDFSTAVDFCKNALALDSNFTLAGVILSIASGNQGKYDDAKKYCLMISKNKEHETYLMKVMINWCRALYFETPNEELVYIKQLIEIDNQNPMFYYQLGYTYTILADYAKAIPAYEKALEIYKAWDSKPFWLYQYTGLIQAYLKTGQTAKAMQLCLKADEDFPGETPVKFMQTVALLIDNDTLEAQKNINYLDSIYRLRSRTEDKIAMTLGSLYEQSGKLSRAEACYRKAYALQPKDLNVLNTLGYFLVNYNRNIDEGVSLLRLALDLAPENYFLMDSLGWGLFKQGNITEALALIEKANKLAPVYNHDIFIHLQTVRKTVTTSN